VTGNARANARRRASLTLLRPMDHEGGALDALLASARERAARLESYAGGTVSRCIDNVIPFPTDPIVKARALLANGSEEFLRDLRLSRDSERGDASGALASPGRQAVGPPVPSTTGSSDAAACTAARRHTAAQR